MSTTRRGWIGSDAARALAQDRIDLAKRIERLPLLCPGDRYTNSGMGDDFVARKVSLHIGGAFVYKSTGGAKPCWYVVCANSGLAFGSCSKAGRANAPGRAQDRGVRLDPRLDIVGRRIPVVSLEIDRAWRVREHRASPSRGQLAHGHR